MDIRVGNASLRFLSAAILLGAGLAVGQPGETQIKAICIEHTGESDKPILPLVITTAKPSRENLKALLGTPANPDHVNLFFFPEAEVRGLTEQIAAQLRQVPSIQPTSAVVLVTVAGISRPQAAAKETEPQQISRQLAAEHACKLFESLDRFEPADAAAGNELKQALATFRKRTFLD